MVRTDVLGPPAKVVPTDVIVEDIAGEDQWYKVERCGGGQVLRARKDEREIEILEHIKPERFV